jgi:hypothetical protein
MNETLKMKQSNFLRSVVNDTDLPRISMVRKTGKMGWRLK